MIRLIDDTTGIERTELVRDLIRTGNQTRFWLGQRAAPGSTEATLCRMWDDLVEQYRQADFRDHGSGGEIGQCEWCGRVDHHLVAGQCLSCAERATTLPERPAHDDDGQPVGADAGPHVPDYPGGDHA